MEVLPIGIEHAGQFNETIMAIASEELFAIHPENLSAKSVYRFVERQVIDGAPMFVALEDDRVVGWCEISLSDLEYSEHSGVLSMGVLPGFRNRGVGSWLIKKCLAAARGMGLKRVELSVLENNPDAQRFYAAKGFKVEGKKIKSLQINGKYHDETIMALWLSKRHSLDYDL